MRCLLYASALIVPFAIIVGLLLVEAPIKVPAPSRKALDTELSQLDVGELGSGKWFDNVAVTYDIANLMMSIGQDQRWRNTLVNDCLQVRESDVVLDLATGTADVALLAAAKVGAGKVLGVDPSIEMLRVGQAKVLKAGLPVALHFGDAQNLTAVSPLPESKALGLQHIADGSVDKISMAFGIRNVKDRLKALKEMRRVLKKSEHSRVCILEFSLPDPKLGFLYKVSKLFIAHAVPMLGYIASGFKRGDEYKHLHASIRDFPAPDVFAAIINRAGLLTESVTHMAYGAVQLYAAK